MKIDIFLQINPNYNEVIYAIIRDYRKIFNRNICLGEKGVYRLRKSRILIIGYRATGAYQAELLARLGVGFIRVVDKDLLN